MPKRIVDGEGVWLSKKLKQVQPEEFRAEFANLIPLALANGTFEADPERIWARVYAYNRPSVNVEKVAKILAEFERVGLLLRWTDDKDQVWGYWVGIEKPGRLPPASRLKHEATGPTPPPVTNVKPMANQRVRDGCIGFGFGFGSGIGSGSGTRESDHGSQNVPSVTLDIEEQVYAVAKVNPKLAHIPAGRIPRGEAEAIAEAIVRDGFDLVLTGTKNLADGVARWPKSELRYVPAPLKFYSRDEYKLPPETWDRGARPRDPELPAVSCAKCMDQGVLGRGVACDCPKGIEAAAAIEWNRKQKASATA